MFFIILFTASFMLCAINENTNSVDSRKADQMMDTLRDRDAQIDNCKVVCQFSGTTILKDHSWKFGGVPVPLQDRIIDNEYLDHMVIRDKEISFLRKPSGSFDKRALWKTMQWEAINGVHRELIMEKDPIISGMIGTMSYKKSREYQLTGEYRHRFIIEFCLGYGFGTQLHDIDSIKVTPNGFDIVGTGKFIFRRHIQF